MALSKFSTNDQATVSGTNRQQIAIAKHALLLLYPRRAKKATLAQYKRNKSVKGVHAHE